MYELKVGTGKVCINPTEDLFPMPGYEGYLFEGVLENIYARSIVLDNGNKRFLFVSVELPTAMPYYLTVEIAEKFHFNIDEICSCAIHNHSAPFGDPEIIFEGGPLSDAEKADNAARYNALVKKAVFDSVEHAVSNLKPAQYGYGEGNSYINVNRDLKLENGNWVQGQNMAGFSDKTLSVMKFTDMDGKLIAAILNYGCHATTAFTTLDTDGKMKITPGFPGIACSFVEERYGNDSVVMWTSGAAGNQNPLFSGEGFPRYFEQDGYAEGLVTPPGTQFMIQKYHGQVHGIDACRILENICSCKNRMKISTIRKTIEMDGQKTSENVDTNLSEIIHDSFVKRYRPEMMENGRIEPCKWDMVPADPVPLKMQLALLGDVAYVGAGAELYNEIAVHMKNASPFKHTTVVTHTDGMGTGYIISDAMAGNNVFKGSTPVRPGNTEKPIIDAMLSMFYEALN